MSTNPTDIGAAFGMALMLCIFAPMTIVLGVVTWFQPWVAIGFVCGLIFCLNLVYRLAKMG